MFPAGTTHEHLLGPGTRKGSMSLLSHRLTGMQVLDGLGPLPAGTAGKQVAAARTQIAARRALHHRNVPAAQELADQLTALAHPTLAVDHALRCARGCCVEQLVTRPQAS